MSFFTEFDEQQFLSKYWQRNSYLGRGAFSQSLPDIALPELAGLASNEDVESRIISGRALDEEWLCQSGPFSQSEISALPSKDWTLLVQGLDHWNSEIAGMLDLFSFLPRWRLDDIMASYAPQGGGVGPHFDYYDVFLIQASGSRHWQLGQQCDEHSVLQENSPVKLLSEFDNKQSFDVDPGDVLYIPAGQAHWGTATTDDCITLSVGFRAPSNQEILIETLESILLEIANQPTQHEHLRYRDNDTSIDPHPYKINQPAQQQIQEMIDQLSPTLLANIQQNAELAFGQLVTEQKSIPAEPTAELWTESKLLSKMQENGVLKFKHHPQTRLAFNQDTLFVNGQAFASAESFSRAICDQSLSNIADQQQHEILLELLNNGDLSLY